MKVKDLYNKLGFLVNSGHGESDVIADYEYHGESLDIGLQPIYGIATGDDPLTPAAVVTGFRVIGLTDSLSPDTPLI